VWSTTTIAVWLPAYLKRAIIDNAFDWLPAREAPSIDLMHDVCNGKISNEISADKFIYDGAHLLYDNFQWFNV
jgi:hypothetical protein